MNEDGRDKPRPEEDGSFDVSKKSGAEIAAEMAAHMARWRRAHRRRDDGAREKSPPEPATRPLAARPLVQDRPAPAHEGDLAMAARIHRALQISAQARAPQTEQTRTHASYRMSSLGLDFREVLFEGPNMRAIGMQPDGQSDHEAAADRAQGVASMEPAAVSARPRPSAHDVLRRASGAATWQALRTMLVDGTGQARRGTRAFVMAAAGACSASWQALRPIPARGLDHARRALRAGGTGTQARGDAASEGLAPASESGAAQVWAHARAIASAVWQARTDRHVLAGAAIIAVAAIGWMLMQPDPTPPARATASPQADTAPAAEPAPQPPPSTTTGPAIRPAPEAPPAIAAAPAQFQSAQSQPAPQASPPPDNGAKIPGKLKPIERIPSLVARLKPSVRSH